MVILKYSLLLASILFLLLNNYLNFVKQIGLQLDLFVSTLGAPSSFPTSPEAIPLQHYLRFSPSVIQQAKEFRERRGFSKAPYLGLHLRHGKDWVRRSVMIMQYESLFMLCLYLCLHFFLLCYLC